MVRVWVVRLGEGGEIADECRTNQIVAIGWSDVGDLSAFSDYESLRAKVYEVYRDRYKSPGGAGVAASMLWSFINDVESGDIVISPKKETRELLVGKVIGDYVFDLHAVSPDYPNIRKVEWVGELSFDSVPREVWRSMTAWQTLFELSSPDAVEAAIKLADNLGAGRKIISTEPPEERTELAIEEGQKLFDEATAKSEEILATHFNGFSGIEFQELVQATLKAAGLYTKPMNRGPDKGVDIQAYRDPLLLGPPRILAQVKHREAQVSAPEMQQFIGTMNREGDIGIFISTGGFSVNAKQIAEHSHKNVSTMGWEDFVKLFLEVYDRLDNEFKAKVPIGTVKVLRKRNEAV